MPKTCNATVESKPCDKSSFATCDGCYQSFCLPHLNAHQQQLATQMEEIVRDYDLLCEELDKPHNQSTYEMPDFIYEFGLIDAWHTRTLAQVAKSITEEADRARNVIRRVVEENRYRAIANEVSILDDFNRLKKRLTMLSEQLQARMKASYYLEPDLRHWNSELKDIKKFSLTPLLPTCMIVSKLVVGETRQIQIDVSNILNIKYEDDKRTQASNYEHEAKSLVELVKEKAAEAYNYVAENDDGKGLVETVKEKAMEAYNYVPERTSDTVWLNNNNSHEIGRGKKK